MGILMIRGGRGRGRVAAAGPSIRASAPRGSLSRSSPRTPSASLTSAWATPTQASSNDDLNGLERTSTRTTRASEGDEDSTRGGASFKNGAMYLDEEEGEYELVDDRLEDGVEGSFWNQVKSFLSEAIFGQPGAGFFKASSSTDMNVSMQGPSSTGIGQSNTTRRLLRSDAVLMHKPRQKHSRLPLVLSDNPYLLIWKQLTILFSAYSVYITPFEFAFFNVPPLGLRIADNVFNIFFLCDIVLTFFVAYKNKRTYLIVADHKTIALQYLCTWFAFDLLGVIPWDVCYVAAGADFTGWSQIFRWLTLLRLVRMRFVSQFFMKLQRDIRLSYFLVRVIQLLLVELYVTHLAGCIFYFLALTYPPDQEGLTWIGSLLLGPNSYENFRELPLGLVYVTSLYWSVVTMGTIGYGDIHAVNTREMLFVMIYITFDLVLSAYLVGNITALVVRGTNTTKYREKMAALIKYMNRNHLPHVLRQQMRQHVRLQYETEQVEDEILEEYPRSLRHKVSRALYKRCVENCYLFANCSGEFVSQVVARVVPEYFFPSEVVVLQRDEAEHMYIVSSGRLEESAFRARAESGERGGEGGGGEGRGGEEEAEGEEGGQGEEGEGEPTEATRLRKKQGPTILMPGCAFGELALLCNIPQMQTVTALELVHVLRLDKEALSTVLSMFIVDGRQVVENVLQRTSERGSKFAAFEAEIRAVITQQEAELTMSTIYSASKGDLDHLRELIRAGANPSKPDYDGRSPLHLAAAGGYDDVVRFLIMEGADVNGTDNFGTTPLLEALRAGHESTARILVSKKGTVSLKEAGSDLCSAVLKRNMLLLRRLLEYGVDPNAGDYDLRTPLHVAAGEGLLLESKLLIEHGANVRARDRWGNTPLDEAKRSGSLPLLRFLEDAAARQDLGVPGRAGSRNSGSGKHTPHPQTHADAQTHTHAHPHGHAHTHMQGLEHLHSHGHGHLHAGAGAHREGQAEGHEHRRVSSATPGTGAEVGSLMALHTGSAGAAGNIERAQEREGGAGMAATPDGLRTASAGAAEDLEWPQGRTGEGAALEPGPGAGAGPDARAEAEAQARAGAGAGSGLGAGAGLGADPRAGAEAGTESDPRARLDLRLTSGPLSSQPPSGIPGDAMVGAGIHHLAAADHLTAADLAGNAGAALHRESEHQEPQESGSGSGGMVSLEGRREGEGEGRHGASRHGDATEGDSGPGAGSAQAPPSTSNTVQTLSPTLTGAAPIRKRVTVFPYPPWAPDPGLLGRVMWLPHSASALLEAAGDAFGVPGGFQRVMDAGGTELSSLLSVPSGSKLFVATADVKGPADQGIQG